MGPLEPPSALWAIEWLCAGAMMAAVALMFATWRSRQPLRQFNFARAGDHFVRVRSSLSLGAGPERRLARQLLTTFG